MATSVRSALAQDWPQLWPLLVGMGNVDDEDLASQRFRRVVTDRAWLVVVAEDDGRLVGYATAQDHGDHLRAGHEGRVARLHDMYVDPARRGTGVGRLLMGAVVGWASTRVRHLQWQPHETRAVPFYEKLGYRGSSCPQPDHPEFEISF